ncbi:MAG: hypothetical protein ACUVR4_09055 [Anaerolineae bacterium]
MSQPASDTQSDRCPGAQEILADLDDDLLDMQPGERLWKLYCFRTAGHATNLRHRIYTKCKPDGRLALITFAVHNPHRARDGANGHPIRKAVRSGIARVPDLTMEDLDRIIAAIRHQVQATAETCEEIDLTRFATLQEQIAWLEEQSVE